jgi:hypothetical protein
MDDIEREHDAIGRNPSAWLKDKPLMRALIARVAIDRISREVAGFIPNTEPLQFPPYTPQPYTPRPFGFDLDEERYGQRDGDETKIFIVQESDYDASDILAVFVGNRLAAYKFLGEYDRYGAGEVVEMDDTSNATTPGLYAQIRRYRDPWTEVSFRTSVDLETATVKMDWTPKRAIRNDIDPDFRASKEQDGSRGRFCATITTAGPETQIEQLRHLHAANVNKIRANVLDDLTKDRP